MATTKQEMLVKYSNVMNEISLKDLSKRELNLFMYLLSQAKNKGSNVIGIPLKLFVQTLDPEGRYLTSRNKVKQAIATTYSKTDKLYSIDDDKEFAIFRLLNYAKYIYETDEITYQINSEFLKILNDFGKNNPFTSFELERFLRLESKHSKNLYRQLMQWEKTGEWDINIEDFRFRMELSANYPPKDIMQKVIKIAIKELLEKGYFVELKMRAKDFLGQREKVTGYVFTFRECVNDDLPGQISFNSLEEFDQIAEDMSNSEKAQALKIAKDIVKGNKKPKKKKVEANFKERKQDFNEIAKGLIQN